MNDFVKAIAAASKQVGGALEVDAHNPQQNYNYISADKILTVAGQALADNGVVILPGIKHEAIESGTTRGGKARFDAVVEFEMLVMAGEGSQTMTWVGRGTDFGTPDKALYKGITSGHKYFLMKLLNIGAGNEDGEHDKVEEQPEPEPKLGNNAKMRKQFHAAGNKAYPDSWEEKRMELVAFFKVDSSNDFTETQAQKMIEGFKKVKPQPEPAGPDVGDGDTLFA